MAIGFVFFWAFLDKCFGLGLSTPSDQAWRFGTGPGDPTSGYLKGVDGPFAWMFNPMAGSSLVTWLYMLGLAGVGVGLLTGLAFRFSAICGCLMLLFFYLSQLPLALNPFIDDHIIQIFLLTGLMALRNGRVWGASRWWEARVGERVPFLR